MRANILKTSARTCLVSGTHKTKCLLSMHLMYKVNGFPLHYFAATIVRTFYGQMFKQTRIFPEAEETICNPKFFLSKCFVNSSFLYSNHAGRLW